MQEVLKEDSFFEFYDFREGCPVCADSSMEMENPKMLSNIVVGYTRTYLPRYIFTTWEERIDEALQILSSVNSSC